MKYCLKHKIATITLLLLFFYSNGQVHIDTIQRVAYHFFNAKVQALDSKTKYTIKEIIPVGNNTLPAYYVVNMKPQGFVIVSNNYSCVPIVAYSFDGNYQGDNINPAFDWWMNHRKKEIEQNQQQKLTRSILWDNYYNDISIKSAKGVDPLLITKWDQGKYYNSLCPADANGPDGHCVTGCVATAVSQIMNYYRWPLSGIGSHSYIHPDYGLISVNFDTCFYDYNEMPSRLYHYSYHTALLLYTTGVSFDMDYGPNGSGVWNHSVANSVKTYFKYSQQTRYIFRDSTTLNWDSLIITHLNARKPLYYAGWEDYTYTSGHAFVCDGYQDTGYYHFNWGWGGVYDGYFYTNQLNPGGANFNIAQELVVDMYPDTINYTYPTYCNDDTITYQSGTIATSNGNKTYLANSQCSWLIHPVCGTSIQLQFNYYDIHAGDQLIIFDGDNDQSPVLAVFDNITVPALVDQTGTTIIKSTSNKMFIKFISDNTNEGYGFIATYWSKYCSVDTLITPSGYFSDGSGSCDYMNNTNCRWYIMPSNAQMIQITFTQFDLPANTTDDYVKIYKDYISVANQVASFNGANPPQSPIIVPSSKAIVRFVTGANETAPGWSAYYEVANGILTHYQSSIKVYPNPINPNAIIEADYLINEIEITDISGKIIAKKENILSNKLKLKDLVINLNKGIYFCKINRLEIIKMVCLGEY